MNPNNPNFTGAGLFLAICVLIFASASWTTSHAQVLAAAEQPAATIKSIVAGNREQEAVTTFQATVTRASGTEVLAASAGTLLFRGDVIQTFGDTNVTVLFFDAPFAERDNEVIIKENSKVGISSTKSWWGRVWVKVKGTFSSNSLYVRLGAVGTEYEFNVEQVGQNANVVVLEGAVDFEEGRFTLAAEADRNQPAQLKPFAALTNFAHPPSAQVQVGRALDVHAGEVTDFSGTYHVLNDCRRTHYFEFRTSNSEWLKLLVQQQAEIPPRVSLPIAATLRINATALTPGQYRGNVYAICVDCVKEPGCTQRQLDWPLNVTVKPPSNPTPTPTPSPSTTISNDQSGRLEHLQEMTFTSGLDREAQATDSRVLSVLNWTNRVLLTTQPSYSSQNTIPHFSTLEERSRSFTSARQEAILKQNPNGHRVLGNVYSDWGQGALAVFAYEKASAAATVPSDLAVDRMEAYRITGQLKKAEEEFRRITSSESKSARALNALGNLNMANAQVATNRNAKSEADTLLQQARKSYATATQVAQTITQSDGPLSEVTAQSNLAEAYLAEGKLAQNSGDLQKAKDHYAQAGQSLQLIKQSNSMYPFPVTDLGRAYQGLGNVAHLQNNETEAEAAYRNAERLHRQAISAHSDFAEAYFNLGDLFEDKGDKEAAKENYWRAIRSRPEQPASYYPLALLIQKENPKLAAALASAYLQLEPAVFKQGVKAKNAADVAQGRYVEPPERFPTLTPGPGPDPIRRAVPNLLNRTEAEALSEIRNAGFISGKVNKKNNSKATDIVMSQTPGAGASAPQGSAIDLVIDRGIEVPDTTDDRQATATKKIRDKRLRLGTVDSVADCRPVGNVVRSNPVRHTRVAPDTVVNLVIASLGDKPITIPNLRRRSRQEAENEILQLGLTLRDPKEEESNETEGTVLKQTPDAGKQYAEGCPVKVELTLAVPWIIVGNYERLRLDVARQQLQSIKLSESVSYQPSSDYEAGIVLSQSPAPGTQVRRGSYVTLVVATTPPPPQPPPQEVMPSVVGQPYQAAKDYLEKQFGLTVSYECKVVNKPAPGIVMAQSLAPGTPIANKPAVVLTVASDACIQ